MLSQNMNHERTNLITSSVAHAPKGGISTCKQGHHSHDLKEAITQIAKPLCSSAILDEDACVPSHVMLNSLFRSSCSRQVPADCLVGSSCNSSHFQLQLLCPSFAARLRRHSKRQASFCSVKPIARCVFARRYIQPAVSVPKHFCHGFYATLGGASDVALSFCLSCGQAVAEVQRRPRSSCLRRHVNGQASFCSVKPIARCVFAVIFSLDSSVKNVFSARQYYMWSKWWRLNAEPGEECEGPQVGADYETLNFKIMKI